MVRWGKWKHIAWHGTGEDQIFDMEKDRKEEHPLSENPLEGKAVPAFLRHSDIKAEELRKDYMRDVKSHKLLAELSRLTGDDRNTELWRADEGTLDGHAIEKAPGSMEL